MVKLKNKGSRMDNTHIYHARMSKKNYIPEFFSKRIAEQVAASLVSHVYAQTYIGMAASFFCATVIFVGLFSFETNNTLLFTWYGIFLLITLLRTSLVYIFQLDKNLLAHIKHWRLIYIMGATLGGASWGLAGIILLPHATIMQQMLLVLMLAGVTAGAVPLSSSIPGAAISFLIFSVTPFIFTIATFADFMYLLFDGALTLYLIYSIVLVLRAYHLIKHSILLKFENDALLKSLEQAKTELEMNNIILQRSATHDPLTKVANRELFYDNLSKAIEKAKSNATSMALLYIDLDQFKSINDLYGHRAGDHVLVTTINRLRYFFGTDSMLARLGGDELAIILENISSKNEVANIAHELCLLMKQPIEMGAIELHISASIGISIYPDTAKDVNQLVQQADETMYEVKGHGGNHFHFGKDLIT